MFGDEGSATRRLFGVGGGRGDGDPRLASWKSDLTSDLVLGEELPTVLYYYI
jgi:hypothetical protein